MRIPLDESFPLDFVKLPIGHEVSTVHSQGWSGVKNGDLLRRSAAVCDVFATLDRNLKFQQNIPALSFGVVVVRSLSNRMVDITPLVSRILSATGRVTPGTVEKVGV